MLRRASFLLLLAAPLASPARLHAQPSATVASAPGPAAGTTAAPPAPLPGRVDVRAEVLYELFVRNATPEGTLAAATRELPKIRQLGATTVWLMPIHPIGEAKRKGTLGSPYSVRDFTAVNPEIGTMDDLRAFVAEAHRLGMKVILDWVANHTAWDHPWVTAHPDWYTTGPDGRIVPPNPDWHDVADLDYSRPALRAAMLDAMRFWTADVGVDGFRCDVADLVPEDFWRDAIAALRAARPADRPLLMLAEGSNAGLYPAGFDLTYDWALYHAMKRVWKGAPIETMTAAMLEATPRLRFTTNHDETAWDAPPMYVFNGSLGAQAAFWTLALLPGTPLVYNGQEHASAVNTGLFERMPLDAVNFRVRDETEAALLVREQVPMLRTAAVRLLESGNPQVLAFERVEGERRVLVVVNVRNTPTEAVLPAALRATYEGTPGRRGRGGTPGVAAEQVVTPALWDGSDGEQAPVTAFLGLPARVTLAPYEVRTFGTLVLRTR